MYRPERGKRRVVTSPLIQVSSISLPEKVSKPGGPAVVAQFAEIDPLPPSKGVAKLRGLRWPPSPVCGEIVDT